MFFFFFFFAEYYYVNLYHNITTAILVIQYCTHIIVHITILLHFIIWRGPTKKGKEKKNETESIVFKYSFKIYTWVQTMNEE